MTEGDILDEVIKNVSICYDNEQRNLAKIAISAPTEGVIRDAAGKLVENVLQNIINTINEQIKKLHNAPMLLKS